MLTEPFLAHFAAQPAERYRTLGASSLGYCQRRLAYAHFPETYEPEPMSVRRRARLMAGRILERTAVDVMKAQAPGQIEGETLFLWPVSVDHDTMLAAMDKAADERIIAHILPGFEPDDVARYRNSCHLRGYERASGIVLDPWWNVVCVPVLADLITDTPQYGLSTAEFKTIATTGFRKVQQGHVDYAYRVQCAIQVDAARVDTHALLYYRLETSHAIELIYSRKVSRIDVEALLSNGQRRVLTPSDAPLRDDEWTAIRVTTPFDERLLDEARTRLRHVLRAPADDLPAREYGPSFICDECVDGMVGCAHCRENGEGRRRSVHSKNGATCKVCTATPGFVTCKHCEGRVTLDEAELPFPCNGYCPFWSACYGGITRVEMPTQAFGRPQFLVKRADYEASNLRVERVTA